MIPSHVDHGVVRIQLTKYGDIVAPDAAIYDAAKFDYILLPIQHGPNSP